MKILISTRLDNENWGGHLVRLTLDRELLKPESLCKKRCMPESYEEVEWCRRNFFSKQFEIGVVKNHPEYPEKRLACFKLIKSYIENTWGRFLDKEQWMTELKDKL